MAKQILAAASDADLVVGAGDFATLGDGLTDTTTVLWRIEVPLVIIAGNHDHIDELRQVFADRTNVHLLHGDAVRIGNLSVVGVGFEIGEIPGALASSILSEQAADELLARTRSADLLVTHAPPYGAADIQRDNTHQGSRAIANWIEQAKPQLCLCGHIHHAWGTVGKIGSTSVHNLGPTLNWFELLPAEGNGGTS